MGARADVGDLAVVESHETIATLNHRLDERFGMARSAFGFAIGDEAGDLVALEPAESQTPGVAISKARSFAAANAGAVAFSRTGDPDVGEFDDAKVEKRTKVSWS